MLTASIAGRAVVVSHAWQAPADLWGRGVSVPGPQECQPERQTQR